MRINGEPYTVVGVLPEGQMDQVWSQLILPLVFEASSSITTSTGSRYGAALNRASHSSRPRADMDGVTANVARAYPKSNKG